MTTYAAKPATAYRSNSIMTASPAQLVVMLYDGARRFLHQASVAMGDRQVALANSKLTRAEEILRHLRATIDMDQGEISDSLFSLYSFHLAQLSRARFAQDPAMLDEVSSLLAGLRDSWATVAGE